MEIIFELLHESYSSSDIQDYFENIIKTHQTVNDNNPIKLYVTKIGNIIRFKIITGYYLELLTIEIMRLLRSTERKITNN